MSLATLKGQNTVPGVKALLKSARQSMNANPDSCIFYSQNAYEIAKSTKDFWAMSKSLTYSGRAKENMGQVENAIRDYFYALKWVSLSDTTDDYNSGVITRNIAAIQIDYRNFTQAIIYYDSALFYFNRHVTEFPEIAKRDNDYRQIYYTRYYRAESLWQAGNILESQQQLLSLLNDVNTPISLKVNAHYQFGFIYNEMQRRDSAILHFKRGLSIAKINDRDLSRGRHNLAMTHFRQQKYKEAARLYRDAIEIKKQLKDSKSLFISILDLGESLLMDNRPNEALSVFKEAINILDQKTIDANPKYYSIYQFMSRCLTFTDGKESQALLIKFVECTNEFQRLQEALRNEHQQKTFDLFMQNYQAEMEYESELTTLDRKYSVWVVIIILLALVASILGMKSWLIYRRKQISKKINQAIRPRNLRAS